MNADNRQAKITQTYNINYLPVRQADKRYQQVYEPFYVYCQTPQFQHDVQRFVKNDNPAIWRLARTTSLLPTKLYYIEEPIKREVIKKRESKRLEK